MSNTEHTEFEEYLAKVEYDRGLAVKCENQSDIYGNLVSRLLRLSYSADAEFAILRQKDEKPEDYTTYYNYVEDAKDRAYLFVYGVQRS